MEVKNGGKETEKTSQRVRVCVCARTVLKGHM